MRTRLALLLAALLPLTASAKDLVVAFVGDNGGEVAPCG
jgi:hypothetical protein